MKKNLLIKVIILAFMLVNQNNISAEKNNYFLEGKKFFDLKDFNNAKFKFHQDIVYNPKSENSYLFLAKIFKIENKVDLEETNLKTVLLLNPKNEEAIYELTVLKIKKSDYEEAKNLIGDFKKVCLKNCKNEIKLNTLLKNSFKDK